MSKTIDEKVVSMQFDNRQFEKNVHTSMSTLDKLKKSLNLSDSAKGLENISASAKKVDMGPLTSGVETVRAKFSAMEVVAVTALANITNSAVNAGKRLVSSLTIDQVSAGWSKYEQKTASVQTIMNATGKSIEEVNAYLEKLMWYSDETSYGFTDMTQSLGQLTSAGGDIEKLIPMIEGIANATAFAGKGASEFSRAIYNLNQSYSAGYLQYMDWKSLDLAGVSSKQLKQVFIDTAKALGKLDAEGRTASGTLVELGNFGQTLQDKWADTSVMEAAFGKFAELTDAAYKAVQSGEYDTASEAIAALADQYDEVAVKAFSSAQEAKSFTEAIEATKDAVSSGWMKTSEIIFGNYEEAKKTWTELANTLWDIFASGAESRNELLEGALNSKWEQLTKKIEEAGVSTEDFQDKLKETAREHGIAIDDLIEEYGSLASVISNGKLSKNVIIETLKKFVGIQKEVSTATENVTDKLETFQKVVNKVIRGDFGNGESRVKALTEAGYEYATVQELVNKVWERNGKTWSDTTITMEDLTAIIGDMSDSELKNIGYTEDQIKALRDLAEQAEKTGTPINELIESLEKPSGRELLIDTFRNALKGLTKVINTFKKAWGEIFKFDSNDLYNIIAAIHSFSEHLVMSDETADKLRRTLKGLFAIIDVITTITGGVLRFALKILCKLFGMVDVNILDVTASLGDALVKFHDWLLENNKVIKVLEKVVDTIVKVIKKIKEWIKAFINLPIVQKSIDALRNAFSTLYEDLKEYFGEGINKIGEFIQRVKDLDSIKLDDVGGILRDFKDNVIDYFLDIDGYFDGFVGLFDGLKTKIQKKINEGVTQPLAGIGVTLDDVKNNVLSFFGEIGKKISDNVGWGEIFTILLGGSLVLTTTKIAKALKSLSGPFKLFMDFGGAINGVLGNIGKALKAFSFSIKAQSILSIALAIGVLAASIALLTILDQDKMKSAIGAIAVLGIALLGLSGVMGAINKMGGVSKGNVAFLALATGVLILVAALKAMEGLDDTKIWDNVEVVIVLGAALVAMALLLSTAKNGLVRGSLTLLSISVALKILIGVLQDLDGIKLNNLGRTIGIIAGAILGLAIVAAACSKLGKWNAIGVLAIVLALKILVSAFKDIADLNMVKMESNIAAFVGIFGMFIILMAVSRLAGANAAKAGLGIMAMSASLILIITAMKMLSKMDGDDLARSLVAISTLLLVFGAVVALSKFSGQYAAKAGLMLLAMSGALVILAGVIVVLSHVKPDGLARALGAITVLEVVFAVLIVLTRFAGDAEKVKDTLIVLSVAIGIMAITLGALSMINPLNLAAAVGAISVVILAFSRLVVSTKYAEKATGTLIVLTVAIGMLGGLLYLIAGLPMESAIAASVSLSILILSLSTAMRILGQCEKVSLGAIGALAIMGLVVGELAIILGLMSHFNVAPSIETVLSLSVLLLAMAETCQIVSGMPIMGAVKGALALGLFIDLLAVIVGGLVALLGALDINDTLKKGAEALGTIGYAIGDFVGSIIGGFGAGLTSGLPEIGENLKEFMTNAQPFFDAVTTIKPETVQGIVMLTDAIGTLVGSSFLDGITKFFSGESSLATFGDQLSPFGENLKKFSDAVADVKPEAVKASAEAAQGLADLANNLPKKGGWAQTILGAHEDIDKFGNKLSKFGWCLRNYSQSVVDVNPKAVEDSAAAAQGLADLANNLPRKDGWAQTILGAHEDIDKFGNKITKFGWCLQHYSQSVVDVNPEAVKASAEAAQGLAELANNLPRKDGWAQTILGAHEDIDKFGNKLTKFGWGLRNYSQSVTNLKTDAIKESVPAAQGLSDLANALPKGDGWTQTIFGSKDISSFGEKLKTFGESLSAYSDSVKNLAIGKINSATSAFQRIANFAEEIADADLDGLGNLSDALEDVGSDCVDNFVKAFSDAGSMVSEVGGKLITNLSNGIKNKQFALGNAGRNLINTLANGIRYGLPTLSAVVRSTVSSAADSVGDSYTSFYNAGSYLVDGLASGIRANAWKAEAEAKDMADAVERAIRKKLKINSPSKVFRHIGYSIPEGLAQGIDRMSRLVKVSTVGMTDTALDGTKRAIARIKDLVSNDIDTQPRIRPVLDLSGVESGADAINGMFDSQASIDVLSNVNAISSMMNNRQNGTNDDVISAIHDLGKQISKSSGDTYSINGITYSGDSDVSDAIRTLVRAARIEGRT